MVSPICPDFAYDSHPSKDCLVDRVQQIVVELRGNQSDARQSTTDTRPRHEQLFVDLTPPGFEHYAGHYRGEPYPCLENCSVTVRGDSRVGAPPQAVAFHLRSLADGIDSGISTLDAVCSDPNVDSVERLSAVVRLGCSIFEWFLRIHPYKDGNGHTARFVLWAILTRYGFVPARWPIHPRPSEPYGSLISQYRSGDTVPLQAFVIGAIGNWPTP